jgi:hypothetical protein
VTFGLNVKPVSGKHVLAAGTHRVTLMVVGHNFDAHEWWLDLRYEGVWDGGPGDPPTRHFAVTRPRQL